MNLFLCTYFRRFASSVGRPARTLAIDAANEPKDAVRLNPDACLDRAPAPVSTTLRRRGTGSGNPHRVARRVEPRRKRSLLSSLGPEVSRGEGESADSRTNHGPEQTGGDPSALHEAHGYGGGPAMRGVVQEQSEAAWR